MAHIDDEANKEWSNKRPGLLNVTVVRVALHPQAHKYHKARANQSSQVAVKPADTNKHSEWPARKIDLAGENCKMFNKHHIKSMLAVDYDEQKAIIDALFGAVGPKKCAQTNLD